MIKQNIPPQNLECENYILGVCLFYKGATERVNLPPQAFYQDKNKFVWDAILSLSNRHEPVDILTVQHELRKQGNLKAIGGAFYLTQLTQNVTGDANLEYYVRLVYDAYARRMLIEKTTKAIAQLYSPDQEYSEVMGSLEMEAFNLIQVATQRTGRPIETIALDWLDRLEAILASEGGLVGVPSGIMPLDSITRGFQEPRMYVVAARPGMGKTDFGLNCVYNSAKYGTPAAFISLEMGDLELFSRMMSIHTQIGKSEFEIGDRHTLAPDGFTNPKIINGADQLSQMGIHLIDAGSMGANDLKRKCRELKKEGVGLIVIDYLGLISLDHGSGRSKTDLLGDVSRMLKQAVAKELGIPVVALHQLNRGVENRPDKRPVLSDLRDSGEIEQDADVVIFLYRPEYYGIETDDNGDTTQGLCELVMRKNRHGRQAIIPVDYNPAIGVFGERMITPF